MPDKKHGKPKTPIWRGGNGKQRNSLKSQKIGAKFTPKDWRVHPRNWRPQEGVTEIGLGTTTFQGAYKDAVGIALICIEGLRRTFGSELCI